ncbi:procathepsin L-like [Symsagittifera roscoffensis]|uniref:procathepsin L-like n=1 Tax=Symsagittifera roscoffensis TaxID=84072 RepID=UPI00307C4E33
MNLIKVVPVLLLFVAVFAFPGKQEKIDSNENKSYLEEIESEFKDEFEDWKRLFKKEYKSFEEEITRFSIWLSNLRYVNQHNLEASLNKSSFTTALNEYSDLSIYDVRSTMNGYKYQKKLQMTEKPSGAKMFTKPAESKAPESIDWREKGYVTPVKNQGQCGSCWSFSSTGSLEGQHFAKTHKLVSLSEQNLVDCTRSYGNMGCNGGLMDYAFQYVKDNGGLDTEKSYPYEAENDKCRFQKSDVGATDAGYRDIPAGDEDALKEAVGTIGPISIAIDASHMSFQMYSGGVYNEPNCSPEQLDHGVLVVGYGTEDGQDYWIVKNSWGESWGENGYIKMSRNRNNQCGVATSASYPVV